MSYKNVKWVSKSSNRKTGNIPQTYTEESSCPDACPLKSVVDKSTGQIKHNGCYATHHFTGIIWRALSALSITLRYSSWRKFLRLVKSLPVGQLWRHNVAGDLPHQLANKERIAARRVSEITTANHLRNGFTYSHYDVLSGNGNSIHNRSVIRQSNRMGFAINVSTNSHTEADKALELAIGPVVTILPSDTVDRHHVTPAGNAILQCPAEWVEDPKTCLDCGACAKTTRKIIIGFNSHGGSKKQAERFLASDKRLADNKRNAIATLADSPLTVVRRATR